MKGVNRDILSELRKQWARAKREAETVEPSLEVRPRGEWLHSRLMSNSHFIPKEMDEYIIAEGKSQWVYRSTVRGHCVTFLIMAFSDDDHEAMFDSWVTRMLTWLHMGFRYSEGTCAQALSIFLYPTPFEKRLPTACHETVGPMHVNSGVTWRCAPMGEIVIFREEEWFKVFIHETFHALGLDMNSTQVERVRPSLARQFRVASDFKLQEAYTETWARILHTLFVSFEQSKGARGFEREMAKNLSCERDHSLSQMHRLLAFIGVPYRSLQGRSVADQLKRQAYREDSNVFAYYVIGGMLMNDPNAFMEWCQENNPASLYNFGESDAVATGFVDYVLRCSKTDEVEREARESDAAQNGFSTRMTILQIN